MIHPFIRNEAQINALRELSLIWQAVDHFWPFDDVLAALAKPGSLAFFSTPGTSSDSFWDGVVLADVGPFVADLLYVFVRPEARGKGIGKELLLALIAGLKMKPQMEALFLEVREANLTAQTLYSHLDMQPVGKRVAYYANGDTALVYRLDLLAPKNENKIKKKAKARHEP
jgi:ribosomal protein S18 acetylase RimI-like enzyme